MLHNRHYLNGVIAELLYPRKDVIGKFLIRADGSLFLRHSDMTFIDKRRPFGCKIGIGPGKFFVHLFDFGAP